MASYILSPPTNCLLKRKASLRTEDKDLLQLEYFLLEEFNIKDQCAQYGIKVTTKNQSLESNLEEVYANDLTENKKEALYLLDKLADNKVTAVAVTDVLKDIIL